MSPSEAEAIETELAPPFTVARPVALKLPLVFNSPHSGRIYPKAFLAASRLDSLALRRSEDSYVEELFGFVTALGAPLPMPISRAPISTSTASPTSLIRFCSAMGCPITPTRNRCG